MKSIHLYSSRSLSTFIRSSSFAWINHQLYIQVFPQFNQIVIQVFHPNLELSLEGLVDPLKNLLALQDSCCVTVARLSQVKSSQIVFTLTFLSRFSTVFFKLSFSTTLSMCFLSDVGPSYLDCVAFFTICYDCFELSATSIDRSFLLFVNRNWTQFLLIVDLQKNQCSWLDS